LYVCIMFVCMYVCMFVHMYVCMCVCIYYVCLCVCMYVCVYVCLYVCMYVRTKSKSVRIKVVATGTNFYFVSTQRIKIFSSCFKTCMLKCVSPYPEGKSRSVDFVSSQATADVRTQCPGDYKPALPKLLCVLPYCSKWYVIRDPTMEKTIASDIYCKSININAFS